MDIEKRNKKNATNAGEFAAPKGPISDHFTDCTNPTDIFLKCLDTEIIDNTISLICILHKNLWQNLLIEESLLVFWVLTH